MANAGPAASPSEGSTRTTWFAVFAFLTISAGIGLGLARTGRLDSRIVSDSPSYTQFPFSSLKESLRAPRTLGYPLYLQAVTWGEAEGGSAALGHWLIHVASCGVFAWGLYALWPRPLGCAFVAGMMLPANIIYRYVDNVTPDVLAASIVIALVGVILRYVNHATWPRLAVITLLVAYAIQLRPAYLFLVPMTPLAVAGLHWLAGRAAWAAVRDSLGVTIAVAAPTALFCLLRYAVVGYFGLVSFGGNNLAGVMTAFMDEPMIARLPAEQQPLAKAILERRREFAAANPEFPVGVITSSSEVETHFDDSTWRIAIPVAMELNDNDWPEANRALTNLGVAIIKASPRRYLVWIAKSIRNAAQLTVSEFVGNPLYLLLLIALVGIRVYREVQRRRGRVVRRPPAEDLVLKSLLYVAVLLLVTKTSLVILTSPPLGRFMDAASILLVTAPAYLLCRDLVLLSGRDLLANEASEPGTEAGNAPA